MVKKCFTCAYLNPDNANYCEYCGAKLPVKEPQRISAQPKDMGKEEAKRDKIIYISLGIIIIIVFIPIIPITYQERKTQTLLEQTTTTIRGGYYQYWYFYIDISNKANNVISGRVIETTGSYIIFDILDSANFQLFKQGSIYSGNLFNTILTNDYSVDLYRSDTYYIVLNNGAPMFTTPHSKTVQITATWQYTEQVSGYGSLFQILTGFNPFQVKL